MQGGTADEWGRAGVERVLPVLRNILLHVVQFVF